MRKVLLISCLLLITTKLFAQQFSQYNTGTLYDSFENPSQRSFIPDSSRQYASNFLFPNIDASFYLTGDAQQTLKTRLIDYHYQNSALQIGNGNKFNYVNVNANAYTVMFKIFTSLNGDAELGFFSQTKLEGSGAFTDESIALLNGSDGFKDGTYNNILNSNYHDQVYNVYGTSYREQITKQFAFGIKFGYVSGISTQNVKIDQSSVFFDKTADTAALTLQGTNRKTASVNFNPLRNPGLDVSIGTTYKTQDAFIIQANVKDLGFIHWNTGAETFDFDNEQSIYDLTSPAREDNVFTVYKHIIVQGKTVQSFTTPLDGRGELSASKLFWVDDDYTVKYSPTLIASKELFYNGFTAALVNPVQYRNYTVSVTTSYNDMRLFDFGGQFMIKSPNAEFFIGSDRIFQSGRMFVASVLKNQNQVNEMGSFTGSSLFIGFSLKFGQVIEHPMNASTIPMGDQKGFLGRLWDKVFNPNAGQIRNN